MNFGDLCLKIEATCHRKDMGPKIPTFVEDARVKLNYRLSLDMPHLAAATDTNEILETNWLLFFYPAMQALYEWIVEFETASYYEQQYLNQVAEYYVNRKGTEPLTIKPENPAP